LPTGDDGGFVGFGVRPKANAGTGRERLDARDVRASFIVSDEDLWRGQICKPHRTSPEVAQRFSTASAGLKACATFR